MSRHPIFRQFLPRSEVSRLLAVCLAFIAIDQLNDPLVDPSAFQQAGYWIARVAALSFGLLGAAYAVRRFGGERWMYPTWLRPVLTVTALGILPLVVVEVVLEPFLPVRPEFADDDLRAFSAPLAFLAEYITMATLILPIHALLWLVVPDKGTELSGATPQAEDQKESTPDFLRRLDIDEASSVLALKAEEHYVKVFTESSDQLVLYRFSAAVDEMPDGLGLQVHRSWWVADSAVETATRGDRRWQLSLRGGALAPVSDSYVQSVRDRGLLSRRKT